MVIRAALFIALFAIQASAQLRVKGRTLEVASERIRVVFDGGDLVRADNLLTRESVAHGAAKGSPTARLIRANGTAEETLDYVWSLADRDGMTRAYLARPDGSSSLKMEVWIDPPSGQIVIRTGADGKDPGLRGAHWGLRALNINSHRLILPVLGGLVFDSDRPPPPNFSSSSEVLWEAPFLMMASRR